MELRHLRYFLAVADAGHVGRAAAALRVAQQSLSAQVADLERELGVALFVRHPRGMTLTRAGAAFAADTRATLAAHARAVEHVRRAGRAGTRLRVGLFDVGAGERIALAGVAAFRAAYPHVALEIDATSTLRQRDRVLDGGLDVGYDLGHPPERPGLAAERLTADPISHVLVPAADAVVRALGDGPVDPAALSHLPYLCFARDLIPHLREDDATRRAGAGYRGRDGGGFEDASAIVRLVAAGAGCAFGPASLGAGSLPPGTRYLPLAGGGGAPMDMVVLTRTGEGGPEGDPLVAAFLACLHAARDGGALA